MRDQKNILKNPESCVGLSQSVIFTRYTVRKGNFDAITDAPEHGVGLNILKQELEAINEWHVDKFCKTKINGHKKAMELLMVSPGLRVIDHYMAGEGSWNYIKMAIQTEDVITSINFLQPQLQQIHEFDWSSGHKKRLEGGRTIFSMNYGYSGKSNLKMRSSVMTIGDVGRRDAFMYKIIDNATKVVTWSLYINGNSKNTTVTQIDCRVNVDDKQIMIFDTADNKPPPPYYKLDAPYVDTPILDKDGKQQCMKKKET